MSARKIHLGMMCQNNLYDLIPNLEKTLPFVDSVTLIDGGSQDETIIYMRNWANQEPKIRFYVYPWKDDFPAQRNNYMRHIGEIAQFGDWCLTADPDEVFEELTLQKLHAAADRAEQDGNNMIGFQCRSVTYRGAERVHENLDEYWKELFFKWDPNFRYTGYKCHEGKGGVPHNIMRTSLVYEHRKQENVIWIRGFRNMFHGGGGPNLGERNPIWVKLRKLCREKLGIDDWHSLYKYLLAGDIDEELKGILIDHMYEGTPKGGSSVLSIQQWDGACFLPGHYVLSSSGEALLLDSLSPGVELLSSEGSSTKAVVPMKKRYSGPVVNIKGANTFSTTLTSNHRVLVAKAGADGFPITSSLHWVPAGELKSDCHFLVYPKTRPGNGSVRSEAEAEFWGWYLACGCRYGNSLEVRIDPNKGVSSYVWMLAREVFPKKEASVSLVRQRDVDVVSVSLSKERADYFCFLFVSAVGWKMVPREVFNWNSSLLRLFMKGLFFNSSSFQASTLDSSAAVYSTCCLPLVHELKFVLSKLGVFADVKREESPEFRYLLTIGAKQAAKLWLFGSRVRLAQEEVLFTQDNKYYYLPILSISTREYSGDVYNVETEDNTYVSGFVVHNSEMREMYRTYFRILHPEEEPEEFRGVCLDDWS